MEYTTFVDEKNRLQAERVTGPMGTFVQGAPPQRTRYNDNDSGGFGGFGGSDGGF